MTTPPQPARAEAVPTGWKLVPVEATEAMNMVAMVKVGISPGMAAFAYRAMLASAPAPASGEVDAVKDAARMLYHAFKEPKDMPASARKHAFEGHFFTALRLLFEPDADVTKPASLSPAPRSGSEAGGDALTEADLVAEFTAHHVMRAALAKPASSPAGGDVVREAGAFLVDRLHEFESEMNGGEPERYWIGHILPALARFKTAALSPSTSAAAPEPPAQSGVEAVQATRAYWLEIYPDGNFPEGI